jgi:hypothetical protein
MSTLTLKDLPHFDRLDAAASQAVRGGHSCVKHEPPGGCNGGIVPPIIVRRGWNECPPVHIGCGPVYMPYGHLPVHPIGVVTPL